ncbi:hypothetical protein D3C81_2119280 [compost metagenome]
MLLFKNFGEPLHADHVAIIHSGNSHCFGGLTEEGEGQTSGKEKRFRDFHRSALRSAPWTTGAIIFVVNHRWSNASDPQ